MAEQKEQPKDQKARERQAQEDKYSEALTRVMGFDIPSRKSVYVGLTGIKGISWAVSKAVCHKMKIPISKKLSELSKDEIKQLESFLKSVELPPYFKNRRFDPETGADSHLYGTDLEMRREFDIKKMKKIKSYKGVRHSAGQPVRGQRTRSHFRQRGKAVGVKKKAK